MLDFSANWNFFLIYLLAKQKLIFQLKTISEAVRNLTALTFHHKFKLDFIIQMFLMGKLAVLKCKLKEIENVTINYH